MCNRRTIYRSAASKFLIYVYLYATSYSSVNLSHISHSHWFRSSSSTHTERRAPSRHTHTHTHWQNTKQLRLINFASFSTFSFSSGGLCRHTISLCFFFLIPCIRRFSSASVIPVAIPIHDFDLDVDVSRSRNTLQQQQHLLMRYGFMYKLYNRGK